MLVEWVLANVLVSRACHTFDFLIKHNLERQLILGGGFVKVRVDGLGVGPCGSFDFLIKKNLGRQLILGGSFVKVRVDGLGVGPCGAFDFSIKKPWRDSLYSESAL